MAGARAEGMTLVMERPGRREAGGRLEVPEAILRGAFAGDAAAFSELIRIVGPRVLRLARRILCSDADAEDASQEVFLRLFKHLHRFDKGRPFEPWLSAVTVNVCREMIKRRGAHRVVPFDEALPAHLDAPAVTAPHFEGERRLLVQALEALPEKERIVMILRDAEDLSTGEIARILGIFEGTVRSHLSRARVKVQRHVQRALGGYP